METSDGKVPCALSGSGHREQAVSLAKRGKVAAAPLSVPPGYPVPLPVLTVVAESHGEYVNHKLGK